MSNSVITGKVVFSNVENTDIYNGKEIALVNSRYVIEITHKS